MTRAARLALVVALAASTATASDRLAKVQNESTLDLTTIGRKSGKPHTKPVWFVVDGDQLWVQAGHDGKTDWYLNLKKTPEVKVRIRDERFTARAAPVDDPATAKRVHELFRQKYTTAWLLSFIGSSIGAGRPVELTPE